MGLDPPTPSRFREALQRASQRRMIIVLKSIGHWELDIGHYTRSHTCPLIVRCVLTPRRPPAFARRLLHTIAPIIIGAHAVRGKPGENDYWAKVHWTLGFRHWTLPARRRRGHSSHMPVNRYPLIVNRGLEYDDEVHWREENK
jgi:hypothetical protein